MVTPLLDSSKTKGGKNMVKKRTEKSKLLKHLGCALWKTAII